MASLYNAQVVGRRSLDYVSKKSGERVIGMELMLEMNRRDVEGLAVGTVFRRTDTAEKDNSCPQLGDTVKVLRDFQRGGYLVVEEGEG